MKKLFYRAMMMMTAMVVLCSSLYSSVAFADNKSTSKQSIYDFYSQNGVMFYSANTTGCGNSSSGGSGTAAVANSSGGSVPSEGITFTLDQVKSFASSSMASTFGVSDQVAEGYFLKYNSRIANHFDLNADNIGALSSAIKAIGVSPTFFWLYAVEEGGGAGGFINHYASDASGGALGNAQRDAQYLIDEGENANDGVATGGGEPSDMPTAEATSFLQSMPSGSIGLVYIQSTSAVTAEIETLSGQTGGWTGAYGMPMSDIMAAIVKLDGNPMSSGASSACGGSLGTGMQAGIKWAKMIADNNGYGYDQNRRTSGYAAWQNDPNCTSACGDFDCSSFVSAILTVAGYFQDDPNFTAGQSEYDDLLSVGAKDVTSDINLTTGEGLQAGDVLLAMGVHTEMYIGDGQKIGAHHSESKSDSRYGEVGDQTGDEISYGPYSNHANPSWTVLRLPSK